MMTKYRTLITRIWPVEVLVENNDIWPTLTGMLKCSPVVPTIGVIQKDKALTYIASLEVLWEYYGSKLENSPDLVFKFIGEV